MQKKELWSLQHFLPLRNYLDIRTTTRRPICGDQERTAGAGQNSAISWMKDCLGTRNVASVVLPFTLKRAVRPFAAGILIFADRAVRVGLYRMKFNFCGGNSFMWAASRRSRFTSINSRSLTCPSASNIRYIQIDSPAP